MTVSRPLTTEQTNTIISGRALVIAGMVLGFFIVPRLAQVAPTLVNGFLLLVLVGALLFNYQRWLPYLAAFETQPTAKKPAEGKGPKPS